MAIDTQDVFQVPPCDSECGALALAKALDEKLGVRVISCTCPRRSHDDRGYVFFHADRRRPDPGPVEKRLYQVLDGLNMGGDGGGRAVFLDEKGATKSGLKKWRLATAAKDRSGRLARPDEAEDYLRKLARRLASSAEAVSREGACRGGQHETADLMAGEF